MNNKNILILTGAGFGKDADLPLEKEIMDRGLQICKSKKPEVIKGLNNLWKLIDSNHSIEDYSFEELLTRIIFEEQYDNRSDLKEIDLLAIKLAVLEIFVQSLKLPLQKELPKQYEVILNIYKDYAYFATLNYDYLIEKLLVSNKIPWNYGIKFDETHLDFNSLQLYSQYESADFPNVFHYLKLHGSFNWHFCWRCRNSRLSELKYFGISGEVFSRTDRFTQECTNCMDRSGQPVMQPLFIPPSAIKYYNSPIFLKIWYEFRKIIEQVEKIIIIGCSVRDDDTMLINTLYNLYKKNSNLRKIVLVDPDKNVQEKIQDYTKMKVERYKFLGDFLSAHY